MHDDVGGPLCLPKHLLQLLTLSQARMGRLDMYETCGALLLDDVLGVDT